MNGSMQGEKKGNVHIIDNLKNTFVFFSTQVCM